MNHLDSFSAFLKRITDPRGLGDIQHLTDFNPINTPKLCASMTIAKPSFLI